MAALRIARDPIASDSAADVPRQQWDTLMEERQRFCTQYLPKDCRNLLFFVEDGAANNWIGYSCAEAYIRGGLGLDPDMVDWAITGLRSLRPDKEIAFDKAVFFGKLGKNGRPKKGEENSDSVRVSGFGNSSAYVISRLQRDKKPDLAEKVIAGELSANAAAIEAGFRKPTLTIPADPDAAVAALIRKFGRAAVLRAIERLDP